MRFLSLVALLHSLHTLTCNRSKTRGSLYPPITPRVSSWFEPVGGTVESEREPKSRVWIFLGPVDGRYLWALLCDIFLFFNRESLINVNIFYFNSIFLFVYLFDIFFLFVLFLLWSTCFFFASTIHKPRITEDILSFHYPSICFVVESKSPLVQSCTFSFCISSHCQKDTC